MAKEELGIEVEIVESLGAYEHLYRESDVDRSGGKHYLANGFVVRADSREFTIDDQHGNVQVFDEIPNNPHQYVENYVQDATAVNC